MQVSMHNLKNTYNLHLVLVSLSDFFMANFKLTATALDYCTLLVISGGGPD